MKWQPANFAIFGCRNKKRSKNRPQFAFKMIQVWQSSKVQQNKFTSSRMRSWQNNLVQIMSGVKYTHKRQVKRAHKLSSLSQSPWYEEWSRDLQHWALIGQQITWRTRGIDKTQSRDISHVAHQSENVCTNHLSLTCINYNGHTARDIHSKQWIFNSGFIALAGYWWFRLPGLLKIKTRRVLRISLLISPLGFII